MTRLGINIDHVATLRQARLENFPDPLAAALLAVQGGADGITAHLREDRRHIQDKDIVQLKKHLPVPLNMEMGANPDIIRVALRCRPAWTCIVPERRQELTTEGGLDVKGNEKKLGRAIDSLHSKGIRVSLFVGATLENMRLGAKVGADAVEIHTGTYARLFKTQGLQRELKKILMAAEEARGLGLLVNAGHGLDYENVNDLLKGFEFNELNIGFSIIARAINVGLKRAVTEMKKLLI